MGSLRSFLLAAYSVKIPLVGKPKHIASAYWIQQGQGGSDVAVGNNASPTAVFNSFFDPVTFRIYKIVDIEVIRPYRMVEYWEVQLPAEGQRTARYAYLSFLDIA